MAATENNDEKSAALSARWFYAASLALCWIVLSGMFSPFFFFLGAISVYLAWYVSHKMGNHDVGIDRPIKKITGAFTYLGWLEWQIILSSLKVTKIILTGKAPSPGAFWTPLEGINETATVIYANSITLTPGTVMLFADEEEGRLLVHALTDEDAEGVASGDMLSHIKKWLA